MSLFMPVSFMVWASKNNDGRTKRDPHTHMCAKEKHLKSNSGVFVVWDRRNSAAYDCPYCTCSNENDATLSTISLSHSILNKSCLTIIGSYRPAGIPGGPVG